MLKMINSLLLTTLMSTKDVTSKQKLIKDANMTNYNISKKDRNISAVSMLYQYTNTPPLAYGSPAPKVAASIIRSKEYNYLPNNGRDNGEKARDRQFWRQSDGVYPGVLSEPCSNIHLPTMRKYCNEFSKEYNKEIDECAKSLINRIRTANSDVLTKGRQTWEPFSKRSVTSPDAYRETLEFFERNLGRSNYTMIEWIRAWASLFDKEKVEFKEIETRETFIEDYDPTKKKILKRRKTKKVEVWTTLGGKEKDERLVLIATEFCSYLKSMERSKLKRRAIASANMILRMFFEIIEEFHLELGKVIRGSTISKGGVEKQTKIMEGLSYINRGLFNVLATEDATKWNECLSPAGFAVMHHCFFDFETRKKNGGTSLNECDAELLKEIMSMGIFLLSQKRIYLGQGHLTENDIHFKREEWYGMDKEKLNNKTKEWFEKIEMDLDERNCVYSPYGMLMGMLNAASTTYGLVATIGMKRKAACVRSSDDSITLFVGESIDEVWDNIRELYSRYKLIGINISMGKTRLFREAFGEYTSWYIDGDFSAQYGVEISTIKPHGDTPHTDFHSSAVETNVSLRENKINCIGAEMMLALKMSNVRRLWRIEMNPSKREGIREEKLLLADGGKSPWHPTNCHLSEIPLKENGLNERERLYYDRIMNPNNPFSTKEQERLTYSHTVGAVINESIELPRNVFCYVRRPNKTLKSTFKIKEKLEMGAAKAITEIAEIIEPSMSIARPERSLLFKDFFNVNINQFLNIAESVIDDDEEMRNAYEQLKENYKKVMG